MAKRILHILNSSSYSGAENIVITTINNMNSNYDCAYASLDGEIRKVLDKNNICFYPLKKMSISQIKKIVRIYNPDIIHAHDYTASIYAALACPKKSIISHLHNNSPWIKKINLKSLAYLISSFFYRKIVTVSSSIMEEYCFGRIVSRKSIPIANPINLTYIRKQSFYEGFHEIIYDLIFLGRLSEAKNPLRFIKIIKKITDHDSGIKAVMVGNGPLNDACKEFIDKNSLNNNISMLGFLENPHIILRQSKLLVAPSKWEGYGLAVIEAMGLGKPVIATPVGGLKDIIKGNCG
ncbi:MAG: glycosyltransferase, partial [Clostridiaceae bacterium]